MLSELVSDLESADVVLIDGRSGSGKTSLAAQLVGHLHAQGRAVQQLCVEDLYPGWDGLAEGSRAVAEVLATGRYQRYDWVRGEFAEWVELVADSSAPRADRVDAIPVLVVEGCGAVTRESIAAATAWAERTGRGIVFSAWLDVPAEVRRSRALARDGEMFRPHWERWAAQEEALFARAQPELLVDRVLQSPAYDTGSAILP